MKTKEILALLEQARYSEEIVKILDFVLEQQERLEKNAAFTEHLRAKLAEIKKTIIEDTFFNDQYKFSKIKEIVKDIE